jgi:Rod binding domain-containing protein
VDPISALGPGGVAPGTEAVQNMAPRPLMAGTHSPAAPTLGVDGIRDASEGFEAIFLRQMLRDLRKTATFDDESSHMTGFYTDMFDDFLAQHLAKAGGIGLAGAIRTYVERTGQ